ncbi:MAG: hypothetical protein JOZ72_17120 [Alphaproteobacteria bacterium]|nr:hypothetical protein [Alphaproteobacteria bacterium]
MVKSSIHDAPAAKPPRPEEAWREAVDRILAENPQPVVEYRNPKTKEEIAEAVKRAQELFAPMAKTYSVDQFIAEKREEAAREYGRFNEPPQKYEP